MQIAVNDLIMIYFLKHISLPRVDKDTNKLYCVLS